MSNTSVYHLPPEIIEHILTWLDGKSLLSLCIISKEWLIHCTNDRLWQQLTAWKGTIKEHQDNKRNSYKDLYKRMVNFRWNETQKGPRCSFLNDKRSVSKFDVHQWDAVRADVGFVSGRHQWEVTIDRANPPHSIAEDDEDEVAKLAPIVVGIVEECVDCTANNGNSKAARGWAMSCGNGRIVHDNNITEYGDIKVTGGTFPLARGDVVQMKLDMDKKTLSFNVNGIDYGIAFDNISGIVYPALSIIGDTVVTLSFHHSEY